MQKSQQTHLHDYRENWRNCQYQTGADPGKILTTAQMVKVKMGVAQGADPPERP